MGQSTYVVVLAGEHMQTIAASGWDKKRIRQFLFEHTHNSHAHLKRTQRMSGEIASPATSRRCGRWSPRPTTSSSSPPAAAPARSPATSRAGAVRSLASRHQGDQAMIEILDPTTEALDADHRVRAAADRRSRASASRSSRTRSSTPTSCWRGSATSSRPSTASPSGRCTTSTTRACRRTPRSSTEIKTVGGRHGRRHRRLRVVLVGQCARRYSAGAARHPLGLDHHRRVPGDRPRDGRAVGASPTTFLAMPHPIANLSDAELDQRAREMVPEIVKLLLNGQE